MSGGQGWGLGVPSDIGTQERAFPNPAVPQALLFLSREENELLKVKGICHRWITRSEGHSWGSYKDLAFSTQFVFSR